MRIFAGCLVGLDNSRAFANLEALVFPSETDTVGLAVFEEPFAVPAVMISSGGPQYTVEHVKSGSVAKPF